MNWITIKNTEYPRHEMPMDGSTFISLWKGRISLTQFDEEEGRFYIIWFPAEYPASARIEQEREDKFTHWMKLPGLPEDY